MIISKTPFRLSFVGGGTDISSFYTAYPGKVVSTSINKYMYITLHEKFDKKLRVAYSVTEEVDDISELRHPLVRESLNQLSILGGVEITSTADIPAKGTGLGSSSSYTVGLLNALHEYTSKRISKNDLAELACIIEINKCREPIGKQDQYAAAIGGLNLFTFNKDHSVNVEKIKISSAFRDHIDTNSIAFYIGGNRSASGILAEQTEVSKQPDKHKVLRRMADIADEFKDAIESSSMERINILMAENWELKKSLTGNITNNKIDEIYSTALKNGAQSGKLLGAGGGGFMYFFSPKENHTKLKNSLSKLRVVDLNMEEGGSKIIYKD